MALKLEFIGLIFTINNSRVDKLSYHFGFKRYRADVIYFAMTPDSMVVNFKVSVDNGVFILLFEVQMHPHPAGEALRGAENPWVLTH